MWLLYEVKIFSYIVIFLFPCINKVHENKSLLKLKWLYIKQQKTIYKESQTDELKDVGVLITNSYALLIVRAWGFNVMCTG